MNINRALKLSRIVLITACTMLSASIGKAALIYHVDINTANLVGNGNGPFSLDFQLTDGSGSVANTVTLTNFIFTGGTATGSANLTGSATGALTSTVGLTDAFFFNEFFQTFTAATTKISFDAFLTTNPDPGPIPDAFSMAILDNSLGPIPTNGLGNSLMLVNISSTVLHLSDVQKFTSTSPDAGVTVSASPVPEPGTLSLGIVAGLLAFGWRIRRSVQGAATSVKS